MFKNLTWKAKSFLAVVIGALVALLNTHVVHIEEYRLVKLTPPPVVTPTHEPTALPTVEPTASPSATLMPIRKQPVANPVR